MVVQLNKAHYCVGIATQDRCYKNQHLNALINCALLNYQHRYKSTVTNLQPKKLCAIE